MAGLFVSGDLHAIQSPKARNQVALNSQLLGGLRNTIAVRNLLSMRSFLFVSSILVAKQMCKIQGSSKRFFGNLLVCSAIDNHCRFVKSWCACSVKLLDYAGERKTDQHQILRHICNGRTHDTLVRCNQLWNPYVHSGYREDADLD